MTEGTTPPRATPRAGVIDYVQALATLRGSVQALGDLIRLQAAEHEKLTGGRSLDIGVALSSWQLSSTAISAALTRLEVAFGTIEVFTQDALHLLRDAAARDEAGVSGGP